MISKELLGEVLKADIRKINNSILDGNLYYYKTFVKCKSKINIYELTHKCKEWALNKDYKLLSMSKECFLYDIVELYDVSEQLEQWIEWFEADTETEAVFLACEYILNNIKQ